MSLSSGTTRPVVTLCVKVVPGSSHNRIAGRYGDGIKVRVSAPPEKGKANAAVVALLAQFLNTAESSITLISGQTQARKVFRIDTLDQASLQQRLDTLGS